MGCFIHNRSDFGDEIKKIIANKRKNRQCEVFENTEL